MKTIVAMKTHVVNTGIGERLRAERERLGLTQLAMAEKAGVSRATQVNYESGKRTPELGYLEAAGRFGVDMQFVLTGARSGKEGSYARAARRMCFTFEWLLGLEEGALNTLSSELVELDEQTNWFNESPDVRPEAVDYREWIERFSRWLATSSRLESVVDAELLARLLDNVAQTAEEGGVTLSTEKRLRAALMLYRDAKNTGEIDAKRTAEAVKLAS